MIMNSSRSILARRIEAGDYARSNPSTLREPQGRPEERRRGDRLRMSAWSSARGERVEPRAGRSALLDRDGLRFGEVAGRLLGGRISREETFDLQVLQHDIPRIAENRTGR